MGCTQSKIENEEAVNRCKERKQLMKQAVSFRNAFAAAHSAYAMALKNTGAALSDYAQGEVQDPQSHYPYNAGQLNPAAPAQMPMDNLRPPPPLPPTYTSPLYRAASMPEIKIPKAEARSAEPTIEEEEENELENDESSNLRQRSSRRRDRRSGGSSGGSRIGSHKEAVAEYESPAPAPAPAPVPPQRPDSSPHVPPYFDYLFPDQENFPAPTLSEDAPEEVRVDSKPIEKKAFDERSSRVEGDGEVAAPAVLEKVEKVSEPPVAAAVSANGKNPKKGKVVTGVEGKRLVKAKVSLVEIFMELDDHFLRASESAHEVSKMLEATRLHYHSNFADNHGQINHSERVMRVITWNRSFRGLQNADDVKDDFDSEQNETHATVLDKLQAWEKKLYDEVKAGELLKYEYQKKIATLNKQQKHSTNSEALEKTKAAVSHLHTRYIVDMQSMDSTVSEIKRLRDEQLYPKLVQLIEGMAKMWDAMRIHHDSQLKVVLNLKYVDINQSVKETSPHHHECTVQLFKVVEDWHLQFWSLVDNQKKYINALKSWLRLNVIPIESSFKEKVSSPPRDESPAIQRLVLAWDEGLGKLPDEVPRTAISNFRAVIDTIMHCQADEIKLKERCEETKKELSRKSHSFEEWRKKQMQHRTSLDEADPDMAEDDRHISTPSEREVVVETLKIRLKEEEDAYQRQCRQVREKTLTSFKNRLPELFHMLRNFAVACSEMYSELRKEQEPQRQDPST